MVGSLFRQMGHIRGKKQVDDGRIWGHPEGGKRVYIRYGGKR